MSPEQIIKKISLSKKYSRLYDKTIARVVANCWGKYSEKQLIKKVKNKLHQAWGAYFDSPINFEKLLLFLNAKQDPKTLVLPWLELQSSTKERILLLNEFYQKIFQVTGQPKTIVDIGSGLNPLTFFWMNLSKSASYYAFDIDQVQAWFLKQVFKKLRINQVNIGLGDALIDKFPKSDVALFLKVLPLFEQQKKGSSLKILQNQQSKFLVVSFPVKSIGSREKGMIDFYSKQFQDLIRQQSWQATKLLFKSELVFIIKKHG